jgi:hypothetical protein
MFRSNNSVYLKLATLWFVLKAFERGASGVFRKASTVLPESGKQRQDEQYYVAGHLSQSDCSKHSRVLIEWCASFECPKRCPTLNHFTMLS